jgi:hypothetical protein
MATIGAMAVEKIRGGGFRKFRCSAKRHGSAHQHGGIGQLNAWLKAKLHAEKTVK